MEGTQFAKNYLKLTEMRDNTSKDIIWNNMCNIFGFNSERKGVISNVDLYDIIADQLQTKSSTVFAWMNKSRVNAKPPFEHLCKIAAMLDIPVSYLMTDSKDWFDNDPALQMAIKEKVDQIIGGYFR